MGCRSKGTQWKTLSVKQVTWIWGGRTELCRTQRMVGEQSALRDGILPRRLFGLLHGREESVDGISSVSYLPAGVYTGIWEDAGCDLCRWRGDEVEDGGGCVFLVDGGTECGGTDEFV